MMEPSNKIAFVILLGLLVGCGSLEEYEHRDTIGGQLVANVSFITVDSVVSISDADTGDAQLMVTINFKALSTVGGNIDFPAQSKEQAAQTASVVIAQKEITTEHQISDLNRSVLTLKPHNASILVHTAIYPTASLNNVPLKTGMTTFVTAHLFTRD